MYCYGTMETFLEFFFTYSHQSTQNQRVEFVDRRQGVNKYIVSFVSSTFLASGEESLKYWALVLSNSFDYFSVNTCTCWIFFNVRCNYVHVYKR